MDGGGALQRNPVAADTQEPDGISYVHSARGDCTGWWAWMDHGFWMETGTTALTLGNGNVVCGGFRSTGANQIKVHTITHRNGDGTVATRSGTTGASTARDVVYSSYSVVWSRWLSNYWGTGWYTLDQGSATYIRQTDSLNGGWAYATVGHWMPELESGKGPMTKKGQTALLAPVLSAAALALTTSASASPVRWRPSRSGGAKSRCEDGGGSRPAPERDGRVVARGARSADYGYPGWKTRSAADGRRGAGRHNHGWSQRNTYVVPYTAQIEAEQTPEGNLHGRVIMPSPKEMQAAVERHIPPQVLAGMKGGGG